MDNGNVPAPQFSINLDTLRNLGSEIQQIDGTISAATGSGEKATRAAVINSVLAKHDVPATNAVNNILSQLDNNEELLVAFYEKMNQAMHDRLSPRVKAFVETRKTEVSKPDPNVNVEALRDRRKKLVEQFKTVRKILVGFDQDVSSVSEPKRSGGGRPAGSKNKKARNVRFYIDSKAMPDSQNNPSAVAFQVLKNLDAAKSEGFSKYLKRVLKETKNVEDAWTPGWTLTLENKTIEARAEGTPESESAETPVEATA